VAVISDPTREAADCGADIVWSEDHPPAFREETALLADPTRLARLQIPDPHGGGRMTDRVQAIALFRQEIGREKLIEGWIEGPMAEGADLRGINTIMMDFYDDPAFIADLFAFATEMGIRFARAQVEAGAELIGIGDAAASLIGPDLYQRTVLPHEQRLIESIHALGAKVRLHICGNTSKILADMGRTGADIIDLDYLSSLEAARRQMGPRQVLLGNLEPVGVLCRGTPASITAALTGCHQAAGSRFIVGAGCEVPRETPIANVRALCDYAHTNRP
jgi:MtaA/CmuA family methyltransferase